jgi:hypothetical protein
MEFEFNFGRRESLSERLERERRERAAQRTEDLLRTLFGVRPRELQVTVRTTVEEDTVFGKETSERTRTATIRLAPGYKLAKQEIQPTVFGESVTTVVVEGVDHLGLPLVTETTETDTVFGKHVVTEVKIAEHTQSQPQSTIRDRVTIRVRRPSRPRSGFPF